MTPEERFDAHEQWLLGHDRAIAKINETFREIGEIQRQQSAVLLEIAQHEEIARLRAEVAMLRSQLRMERDGRTVDRINLEADPPRSKAEIALLQAEVAKLVRPDHE